MIMEERIKMLIANRNLTIIKINKRVANVNFYEQILNYPEILLCKIIYGNN